MDACYENARIGRFLTSERAGVARSLGLSAYRDLVALCERTIAPKMYEPTREEVDDARVGMQTEEILASLVRDILETTFQYKGTDPQDQNTLLHDCFHLARSIVLRRRAALAPVHTGSGAEQMA